MIDYLLLILVFIAGAALGFFYFGTLWLTVNRIKETRYPILLVLGSFLGRLAVTMGGFYLVFGGRWERIVLCLVGFLLARTILIRRLGPINRSSGE